jgi:signal transduction histidine kinase
VAGLPITIKDRPVGVIYLYGKAVRKFTPQDIELLSTIGDQIGVAIENARLFQETQGNLERVRALREIDQAITSTLDLDAVLNVLLQKIDLVLPYSATTVRLFNKQSRLLEPVACRNLDEEEWKAGQWRAGRGIPNVVFETRAPVRINNVQTDPRNKDLNFFSKHGLVSYLGVPLIVQGEVLGVISFYTKEEHEFSDEEVDFLYTLAGQAAIAIHNSQLYEEMAKLAADLSRSNKVKDEFLSVMSHELRTPLNVLMGYTAMIKDGMLGETNREQKSALEKVLSQANDLLTMITSVLYATSIETREVQSEPHRFALGDFLDALRTAYDVPRDKALALIWNYAPDLPAVETDSEKLKYILHNLIHNAIKFTERGQVTISARIKRAGTQRVADGDQQPGNGQEERLIEFKVADTGIGISQEKLPLIFEKFRQADSSETRLYGGIGLGLYVAKNFAELHGGKIEVETEQGKGSTFTVKIPCVIGSAATDGSQEKEQQVLGLQDLTNPPLPLGLGPRSQEL